MNPCILQQRQTFLLQPQNAVLDRFARGFFCDVCQSYSSFEKVRLMEAEKHIPGKLFAILWYSLPLISLSSPKSRSLRSLAASHLI